MLVIAVAAEANLFLNTHSKLSMVLKSFVSHLVEGEKPIFPFSLSGGHC